MIAKNQSYSIESIEKWSLAEGELDKFEIFKKKSRIKS
jgi:hypothetical protein